MTTNLTRGSKEYHGVGNIITNDWSVEKSCVKYLMEETLSDKSIFGGDINFMNEVDFTTFSVKSSYQVHVMLLVCLGKDHPLKLDHLTIKICMFKDRPVLKLFLKPKK